MADRKVREVEKSPKMLSLNSKEESLLKKKILSMDIIQKQVADSMTLEQKILYNRFIMKVKRSELAYAKLAGNKDRIKQLSNSIFPTLNTTLNSGAGEAMKAILGRGVPLYHVAGLYRQCDNRSYFSQTNINYRRETSSVQISGFSQNEGINATNCKAKKLTRRFHSAPGAMQGGKKKLQLQSESMEEKGDEIPRPEQCTGLMKTRPKTTNPLLETCEDDDNSLITNDKINISKEDIESTTNISNENDFESRINAFLELLKSMQQPDNPSDYYSERMYHGTGKREIAGFTDEEEKLWLPVGKESYHQSITIKKLDTNIPRRVIPMDIMQMEQYHLVLTKENLTVRKWMNNNPYDS